MLLFEPNNAPNYAAAGHAGKALETADRALADLYQSEHRAYESTVHRIRRRGAAPSGGALPEKAERCFHTAIEIAHRQSQVARTARDDEFRLAAQQ
jgi:hypothetical protein